MLKVPQTDNIIVPDISEVQKKSRLKVACPRR